MEPSNILEPRRTLSVTMYTKTSLVSHGTNGVEPPATLTSAKKVGPNGLLEMNSVADGAGNEREESEADEDPNILRIDTGMLKFSSSSLFRPYEEVVEGLSSFTARGFIPVRNYTQHPWNNDEFEAYHWGSYTGVMGNFLSVGMEIYTSGLIYAALNKPEEGFMHGTVPMSKFCKHCNARQPEGLSLTACPNCHVEYAHRVLFKLVMPDQDKTYFAFVHRPLRYKADPWITLPPASWQVMALDRSKRYLVVTLRLNSQYDIAEQVQNAQRKYKRDADELRKLREREKADVFNLKWREYYIRCSSASKQQRKQRIKHLQYGTKLRQYQFSEVTPKRTQSAGTSWRSTTSKRKSGNHGMRRRFPS